MGKFDDLTGQKFGRLLVTKFEGWNRWSYYLCKCDCGKEKSIRRDHLKSGRTVSCGCYQRENCLTQSTTHNCSYHRLYHVWSSMMDRCYREAFADFHNYGGRGICVDERWHSLLNFIEDMDSTFEKGLQLDRIDNDGNYTKSNTKWSTRKENNRNKRTNRYLTVNGERKVIVEWAEITGIPSYKITNRMNKGLDGKDALYGIS